MEYKTKTGFTLTLKPVSDTLVNKSLMAVEKRFKDSENYVPIPVYDIEIDFGDGSEPVIETHEHTEETLEIKPDEMLKKAGNDSELAVKLAAEKTALNIKEWAKYNSALERMEAEKNEQRTKTYLIMGVDCPFPDNDDWMKEQEFLGIEIPENELERKYHYLITVVMTSPLDLLNVIQEITKLSFEGIISEEDVDAAMQLFRRQMEVKPTKRGRRHSNRKNKIPARALEVQLQAVDNPHGEGMGTDTVPIQEVTD